MNDRNKRRLDKQLDKLIPAARRTGKAMLCWGDYRITLKAENKPLKPDTDYWIYTLTFKNSFQVYLVDTYDAYSLRCGAYRYIHDEVARGFGLWREYYPHSQPQGKSFIYQAIE